MPRKIADRRFAVLQLNRDQQNGWAVIGLPSGAIVTSDDDRLFIRLERDEAEQIAERLNGRRQEEPEAIKAVCV